MAKSGQGENVHFDQVLLVAPFLGQERPVGANAGAVDQQVDVTLAFFKFQQETGQAQWFAQIAGAKQHFNAKTLGQLDGDAFQWVTLAGHQDQIASPTCQRLGQCQAQLTGGTSDHGVTGHAVLQSERAAKAPSLQVR
ncbi:hypothetical protein D3C84_565400 [compost metagenome]